MAALMLGTVFKQTKLKYQLKLLAGEQGLHRSLRWMYVSEDIGNVDFFQGGELVIFTGFSFESITEFETYVKMLIQHNCCGVIVNVGKYIFEQDISKELMKLCEEQEFPLITMPWRYYLTDILQEYNRQIFFYKHEQDQITYVFKVCLKKERPYSEEDEARLLANHFHPQGDYCISVISVRDEERERLPESILRSISALAENQLNQVTEKACVFPFQDLVVLILHAVAPTEARQQMESILDLCQETFPQIRLFGGTGSVVAGVEKVKVSYDRACAAMRYAIKQGKRALSFEEMDEFQLLYSCRDQAVLNQFTAILCSLEAYEEKYGNQFTETLRLYLQYNGSVNRVSEELNCHRNTINYRIKKIKELLHADLDSKQVRFQLQLAFSIRDYQRFYRANG